MNEKNRNLVLRIVTSLVLLPLVIFVFWRGGAWITTLLSWAAGMCAAEYYLITQKRLTPFWIFGAAVAALLPALVLLAPRAPWEAAFWVVGATFLAAWTWMLLSRGAHADAPVKVGHLLTGVLYAGMGMAALNAVRLNHGMTWAIAALTVTWANDTFAYFGGRFFGRHKLYPEVSPNKTWEGFIAGVLGSVVGLFIQATFFTPDLRPVDCLLLGLAGGLLGPVGDLSESMLKRAYQVKDSGTLIPGHGGVLDRLDALLFNAPLVFLYVQFLRP
ncbi:MAG: phosphatidate cytidylyltransferase [Myxococcaceae bacterium]|nr:phosphatidate cytidylyltransferase [Myxococcaceae bacterium]MCI0671358.1 phosphatidate cytidylyltransferase [Myxococcaceae bacterium]